MLYLVLTTHLQEIVARPSFFQRDHEEWSETHFTEAPASVVLYLLVVVASGDDVALAVVNRLGFQIGVATGAIAGDLQDMVMDELADAIKAAAAVGCGAIAAEAREKIFDLFAAFGLAQMREIKFAVLGEEVGNLRHLSFVDTFMVAIAQIAQRLAIVELGNLRFELLHLVFEVHSHRRDPFDAAERAWRTSFGNAHETIGESESA